MIKDFKFFNEKKYNFEDDPLYRLNVYENMVLGVISYCYRMNLTPVGYQHHFYMGQESKYLKIIDLTYLDNFGRRDVGMSYQVYDVNNLTHHRFQLDENVFNEVMRRYENL
jgi:hypothetical protein